MARFDIRIASSRPGQPGHGRTLGPVGRFLAAPTFAALAAGLLVLAFMLGYLVLGLAAAALLVAVLAALVRVTLRHLRG
jgi:hypothetical protein